MRVAINASILHGPVTGIAKYLLAVISKLSNYKQHTFYIYLLDEIDLSELINSFGDNVVIRSSKTKSRLGKKIWEQLVLPKWSHLDEIDVFWSPSHHLPLFLPNKIKKVVTIHDVVWKVLPQAMPILNRVSERILMPLSLCASDIIITVSKSTAADVTKFWPLYSDKVIVSYPSFRTPKTTALKVEELNSLYKKYILFVGTIEPRKNLANLMKAYLELPELLTDEYPLVIVGGKGWGDKGDLSMLIEKSPTKFKFLGYVSDEHLAALYQQASLFIMPSIYEGFGLPLVEAMSYGVPVITSNCSSMPEVVDDSAILVDPHDVGSIKQAMQSVLTDEVLQACLKTKAKKRVDELLSNRPVDKLVEIFERT